MWELYRNIPSLIDPIVFSIRSFDARWYSLMYLVGFFVIYEILIHRLKSEKITISGFDLDSKGVYKDRVFYFLFFLFFGAILGARLGYVFFYDLDFFLNNPSSVFLPISSSGDFVGFFGMSYHGGILGVILIFFLYSRYFKVDFWRLADFFVVAAPAGYFFGRIGNFLNGELYGRETVSFLGMNFGDDVLRHPSQIYEAFFEGIVLFVVLWVVRKKYVQNPGVLTGIYVLGYGIFRFFVEFYREPDVQLGLVADFLTIGQIFSLIMIILGGLLIKIRK